MRRPAWATLLVCLVGVRSALAVGAGVDEWRRGRVGQEAEGAAAREEGRGTLVALGEVAARQAVVARKQAELAREAAALRVEKARLQAALDDDAAPCDLPRLRVGADGVTSATILETLRALGDTPVLLEGALDTHWARALSEWSDAAYFRARFGRVHVPKQALVNKTLDVAQDGPNSRDDRGSTLDVYLRDMFSRPPGRREPFLFQRERMLRAVSYTHLTLPTIYSV